MLTFRLFVEGFDKISDFMLNPEHRNKELNQLVDEFKKSGGEVLGYGSKSQTYSHPSWPYVLKVFSNNEFFLKFARFAYAHPHSGFPKFYGPPQRVVPFFTRYNTSAKIYLTRTEKLYHVEKKFAQMVFYILNYPKEPSTAVNLTGNAKIQVDLRNEFIKKHPEIEPLFEAKEILNKSGLPGAWDESADNLMKRKDGSLVLNDPFWEGSNPYKDYDAAMRSEMDDFPDYVPPTLVGGKMPKKPKP